MCFFDNFLQNYAEYLTWQKYFLCGVCDNSFTFKSINGFSHIIFFLDCPCCDFDCPCHDPSKLLIVEIQKNNIFLER